MTQRLTTTSAFLVFVLLVGACGGDAPLITATPASSATATATESAACRFEDAAELVVAASALVVTADGFGTAFYIGDGEFVTAEHVIHGFLNVSLESDLFTADAEVVVVDRAADVALLRVASSIPASVAALRWFDGERVRPGEFVGTAGYPVDVTGTAAVTRGTLSRLFTSDTGAHVIQTDAPVNPGNSGGALFDECGAVVGVVVEKWDEAGVEGVAYATAYDTAQTALAEGVVPSATNGGEGTFGDGTYEVGVDLRPGIYRNSDSSAYCYWARLSGFREDPAFGYVVEDTIQEGISYDLQTVLVQDGDAGFYALDCGEWTYVGPVPSGETRSPFDLELGDCMFFNVDDAGDIATVFVVDCSDPHDFEVYDVFGLPDGPVPSGDVLTAAWTEGCLAAFRPFVGIDYQESRLEISALLPTTDGWATGDRLIQCYLYDYAGDLLVGSMRDRRE